MVREIGLIAALLFASGVSAYGQVIQGPLQAQNSLSELAHNGTGATALANLGGVAPGGNFGTPSAIILTNGTGLPLTTGVTGILSGANGGTGVANSSKTITLGGNLTTSGAFTTTFTDTANTSVTLPTSGTLLNNTTGALAGANTNITSITGLTTPLAVNQGGTGANTSTAALTNLGAASINGSTIQVFSVGPAVVSTEAPQTEQTVGGLGTSYVNVTGSRSLGTTFTNSTGAPIAVSASASSSAANSFLEGAVNGVFVAFSSVVTAGEGAGIYFIVPPNDNYSISITSGTPTLGNWFELEQ
jgi:hypothetical protein